jgi:hypothetical protein
VGRGALGGGGSSRDGTALPRSFTRPLARSIRSGAAGGPGLRTQPLSRPAGGGCGGERGSGSSRVPPFDRAHSGTHEWTHTSGRDAQTRVRGRASGRALSPERRTAQCA